MTTPQKRLRESRERALEKASEWAVWVAAYAALADAVAAAYYDECQERA